VPTPRDREAALHAKRSVQIALGLLIVIVVALVTASAVAAYRIYSEGNHRFIDQAGPFFAVSEDLAVEMLNEETGVRGYVISHDPKLLAPYYQGHKYAKLELALLQKDEGFDPAIPAHLAAMKRQVNTLQAFFAKEIALVKAGPAGQRQAAANTVAGKGHFDHLRAASAALVADAGNVIRRSHRDQRATLVTWWAFLGLCGALAIAIALMLMLRVPAQLYRLFREERMARRDAEQAADASRALAHVRESVVLLDDAGRVRYRNGSAGVLFGLAPGERESRALRHVLDEFHGAGAGARPVVLDGRERWLTATESEFEGGHVVVFRDVSDDQRLERLRADFVATAAHELRTPLAAVYGAVRTLRQEEHELPKEVAAQFLEMIEIEAERLKLVMDQLLLSAQLDSATLHLHHQPVDAVELCAGIVGSAQVRKPAEIELDLEQPNGSVSLDADPERLRQVIANLIDNAIKYSPGGGRVEVRVTSNGTSGLISVADQGLGIPVHEQQRIFEKFYRLDPSMTRGIGGSGLGLYISRELVQQMGGRLSVASRYGTGSTFTVTLPLA
jgi:signal transduction histidine kinase